MRFIYQYRPSTQQAFGESLISTSEDYIHTMRHSKLSWDILPTYLEILVYSLKTQSVLDAGLLVNSGDRSLLSLILHPNFISPASHRLAGLTKLKRESLLWELLVETLQVRQW